MTAIKELGHNFTVIDFYLNTRFTPFEIIQEAEKTLDIENIKLLKKYIAQYRDIKCINSLNFPSLITDKLVLNVDNNLIEIQPEVKKQIIDFLKNNEIPVSNETLKISCIKYYRNELYKNIDSMIY